MKRTLQIILKSPKTSFGLFLFCIFSCGKSSDRAIALIKDSIEAHGGLKNYDALKAINFVKTVRLFREDGSLESEVVQEQSFQLKPDYKVQITWTDKGNKHLIYYDGMGVVKTINGRVIKDSLAQVKAKNSAKAAAYVFFQPFELLKNTELNLEETLDLNDSTSVKTISVKYLGDTENSDKWTYYFDDDNVLVANSVEMSNHNSLIENIEFQSVSGLLFNKHRKSFRVDGDLNKLYMRAEYYYEDISVVK